MLGMHALGLEFDSAARLSKRLGIVCSWKISLESRVLYPGPGFICCATWHPMAKKHSNGLINQSWLEFSIYVIKTTSYTWYKKLIEWVLDFFFSDRSWQVLTEFCWMHHAVEQESSLKTQVWKQTRWGEPHQAHAVIKCQVTFYKLFTLNSCFERCTINHLVFGYI